MATLIQRYNKKSFHFKNKRLKFYWLSVTHFLIVLIPYINSLNLFSDNKIYIFEEYGAFKLSSGGHFLINTCLRIICGTGLDLLQSSGKFPCAVSRTGVGSNSIFCSDCKHWVHKKCSGLKHLTKDSDNRCTWCQGTLHAPWTADHRGKSIRPDKLEVLAS